MPNCYAGGLSYVKPIKFALLLVEIRGITIKLSSTVLTSLVSPRCSFAYDAVASRARMCVRKGGPEEIREHRHRVAMTQIHAGWDDRRAAIANRGGTRAWCYAPWDTPMSGFGAAGVQKDRLVALSVRHAPEFDHRDCNVPLSPSFSPRHSGTAAEQIPRNASPPPTGRHQEEQNRRRVRRVSVNSASVNNYHARQMRTRWPHGHQPATGSRARPSNSPRARPTWIRTRLARRPTKSDRLLLRKRTPSAPARVGCTRPSRPSRRHRRRSPPPSGASGRRPRARLLIPYWVSNVTCTIF